MTFRCQTRGAACYVSSAITCFATNSMRHGGKRRHGSFVTTSLAGRMGAAYFETMLDWSECPLVERVPGKVSGVWLFKGTRVPVKALFENLESGARVDEFLEWFPGVTREQVEAVLEHAERSLAVA